MSGIDFPPVDVSELMPRGEAESAIAGFNQRITALEGKRNLSLLGTATVGETLVLGLSLGVRRYSVAMSGAAIGDRLTLCLTGAPQNGTIQDAYVSANNTVNIGLLVPTLAVGAIVAVPVAVYKVV